jgi:hypothetical protein
MNIIVCVKEVADLLSTRSKGYETGDHGLL